MNPSTLWMMMLLAACGGGRCAADMVIFSEIMHHPATGKPEYLIVENLTATPFDIAGWEFSEGIGFRFPEFTTNAPAVTFLLAHERIVVSAVAEPALRAAYRVPAALRVFGPWQGKLANEGERVTLRDKNGVNVGSLKYRTDGHWPAAGAGPGQCLMVLHPNRDLGQPENWAVSPEPVTALTVQRVAHPDRPATAPSPGRLTGAVILNEIFYDPPPTTNGGEFIELFNRSAAAVDLTGWRLAGGVDFAFPTGTRVPPGGFLIVAGNLTQFTTVYGARPVVGSFVGKLRNEGEAVRLLDGDGGRVDEVGYQAGGDWPEASAGGGSSLERLHPDLNGARASAWGASDERAQAPWRHFACTNVYLELNPVGEPSDYRELHMRLAGGGEVALQHLVVVLDETNRVALPARVSTDGTGRDSWLCQGTHAASVARNGALHLVADGPGDDRANRIEIDVPELRPGVRCELHFDARWVTGSPRLLMHTWDRSVFGSFLVEVPARLGTPGQTNSCALAAPPPQLDDLTHAPAVPQPNQPIRVSVRVRSGAPLASVTLLHRWDAASPGVSWARTPMSGAGAPASETAGDARTFAATLPGRAHPGAVLEFLVEARTPAGLTATMPRCGTERPALLVVDARPPPSDLRRMRVVVAPRDVEALTNGNTARFGYRFPRLSNHGFNATVIADDNDILYGAELRARGSPISRLEGTGQMTLKLPADRAFRGHTRLAYDDEASRGRAYHNRVTRHLLYLLGQPVNRNEFVRLAVNHGPAELREEVEPVGDEFLRRVFPDGDQGELYRVDLDWSFPDNWAGVCQSAEWQWNDPETSARWRFSWLKQSQRTRDDHEPLMRLFRAVTSTNAPGAAWAGVLNAPAALRVVAVRGYIGDWDCFTMQQGRNTWLYRPPGDERFLFLHWDSDEAFVTGQPFYGERVRAWVEHPSQLRIFHRYVRELVRLTSREPERLAAWLAAERAASAPAVIQADYANFFRLRAGEAEAWLAETEHELARAGRSP